MSGKKMRKTIWQGILMGTLLLVCQACTAQPSVPRPTPTLLILAPTASPACSPDLEGANAQSQAEVAYKELFERSNDTYDSLMVDFDILFGQIRAGVDSVLVTDEWQMAVMDKSAEVLAAGEEARALVPPCRLLEVQAEFLIVVTYYNYIPIYMESAIRSGDPDVVDGGRFYLKRGNEAKASALALLGSLIDE